MTQRQSPAATFLDEAHNFMSNRLPYEALQFVERYRRARRQMPEPWRGADSQADEIENAALARTSYDSDEDYD